MHSIMLLLLSLEGQEGQIVELHINVLPVCAGSEEGKLRLSVGRCMGSH